MPIQIITVWMYLFGNEEQNSIPVIQYHSRHTKFVYLGHESCVTSQTHFNMNYTWKSHSIKNTACYTSALPEIKIIDV